MDSIDIQNYLKIQKSLTILTQTLRKIFIEKYEAKTKKKWIDSIANGKSFCKGIGKNIYTNAKKIQQSKYEMGNSNEWDITMFVEILNELFFEKSLNKILLDLKTIRNKIAHRPTITISQKEFNEIWPDFKILFSYFKVSEAEINKILNNNNNKNNNNNNSVKEENKSCTHEKKEDPPDKEAQNLKAKANDFFHKEDFEKAIELYSEILSFSTLTNQLKATLFSNRSCAHLKVFLKTNDEFRLLHAISDAKQAIINWPFWSKGYIRLGLAYKHKNKLKKSLTSFEKAVEIDPTDQETRDQISQIKIQIQNQNAESSKANSFLKPFNEDNLQENSLEKKNSLAKEITEQTPLKNGRTSKNLLIGLEYLQGSIEIKRDEIMAYRYFAKAANEGNPEGMYYFALGLIEGIFVSKDTKAGLALLEKTAILPAFDNNRSPILGIADSQFVLGGYFEMGTYVPKNINTAIYWYEKATENEHILAPNNLGMIYYEGKDRPFDLKKAEKYFQLAHSRKHPVAIVNLVEVYIALGDHDLALKLHEEALQSNNLLSIQRDKNVRERINFLKRFIPPPFNYFQNTSSNTNTTEVITQEVLMDYYDKILFENPEFENLAKNTYDPSYFNDILRIYNPALLENYKRKGSAMADSLLQAGSYYIKTLDFFYGCNPSEDSFIENLAKAININWLLVTYDINQLPTIEIIIEKTLNKWKKAKNYLDECARVCSLFCRDVTKLPKNFIAESVKKYPNNFTLNYFYIQQLLTKKMLKQALSTINSLSENQMSPMQILIFYFQKGEVYQTLQNAKLAIENFKIYLQKAPKDHNYMPLAYYKIAFLTPDEEEKNTFFNLGLESEKQQLPFFLPVQSKEKIELTHFIETEQSKIIPKNATPNPENDFIDPKKAELFIEFRRMRDEMLKMKEAAKNPNEVIISWTTPTPNYQPQKLTLVGLKAINFYEMNKEEDKEYAGFILTAMIVDEIQPPETRASLHMIVQDERKDFLRLCIYNLTKDIENICKTYQIGVVLQIVNPFLRVGIDKKAFIKVMNPDSVIIIDKKNDICRFCMKENSKLKCEKCFALYCSIECRDKDLKFLRHDYICQQNKGVSAAKVEPTIKKTKSKRKKRK